MATEYLHDSSTELGVQQLGYLNELLDEPSKQFIQAVTAKPGDRCLELGAGSGSIARWLAERVGSGGSVVAVDIDDTHLTVPPGVRMHRHDINDGLPAEGPFDLIHSRLLLMHLRRRKEILSELVEALAPGGWLVVGDCTFPGPRLISAPCDADARLFHTVVETALDKVARPGGVDYDWGYEIDAEMTTAGLCHVDTMELTHTTNGGATASRLYSNSIKQLDAPLRAHGLTTAELTRFHELMLDPRMRVWFLPFLCTRGQKPATSTD